MSSILQKTVSSGMYLLPGQVYISDSPALVWTILGSCVSIVLYDRNKKLGSICHAQLPEQRTGNMNCSDSCPHPCDMGTPDENIYKFVTCSFRYMYTGMLERGSTPDTMEAGIYGGSRMLKKYSAENIGGKNIAMARRLVLERGLPILGQDVGGEMSRKLTFDTASGTVKIEVHRGRTESGQRIVKTGEKVYVL